MRKTILVVACFISMLSLQAQTDSEHLKDTFYMSLYGEILFTDMI